MTALCRGGIKHVVNVGVTLKIRKKINADNASKDSSNVSTFGASSLVAA